MLSKLGKLNPRWLLRRGRWVVPVLVVLALVGFIHGLRAGLLAPAPPAGRPAPPATGPAPPPAVPPAPVVTPTGPESPAPAVPTPVDPSTLAWPLRGPRLRAFGWTYSPTFADWRFHPGVDIGGAVGEPVRAALAGTVLAVERSDWHGITVLMEHGSNLRTRYGHLGRVMVRPGDQVASGTVIAELGQPGAGAAADGGARLFFKVYLDGAAVDPARFLR